MPKTPQVDNTITLVLDRAELEELQELCMGISKSALVRHLIRTDLARKRSEKKSLGEKHDKT